THRHFGLALSALAWPLLSTRTRAATRARACLALLFDRRTQWQLLFAAASRQLPALARRNAGRLRVRGQGQSLHHPYARAARRGAGLGDLLRPGPAGAGAQARAAAVAVSGAHAFRPGADGGVPRPAAAR